MRRRTILSSIHSRCISSYLLSNLLAACVLLLALSGLAYSQEATIVGTVTDPSGAVIPGVKVNVTNTDKNQVTDVTTNDSGQFVVPSLTIGHYMVKAEVAGFKRFEQNDINLQVGDRSRVDIKLQVGDTKDSITVEAEAIAVQSESGEVSEVITNKQMTQLATNGRSIYALTTLVPGASGNMSDLNIPTPLAGNAGVSFNGMRQSHNLYLIDGGEAADRGGAGGIDVMPSMDAIAEFRANTSNYGAEYGLSSSATMTLSIASGEKTFHAKAWEFLRNDALQGGNYFTNASGKKTPELRQNTYGFQVNGPVTFGKLYNRDRDKTFFMYNMEWRSLIQGGLVNQPVPPTSEYGGQFPAGTPITVPTTVSPNAPSGNLAAAGLTLGAPFPGNRIPASLLNPNSLALLQQGIFPAQNSGGNFLGGNKLPTNLREEIVRIDHRFSDKFNIFGHLIYESSSQTYGTSLWSGDNVPTVGTTLKNPAYHAVIHATYSITPTILNEVSYNQNGNTIDIVPVGIYQRPSGLSIPELFPGNNLNRNPGVQLSTTGTQYDVNSWPWHNKADDYQFRDDLSLIKGQHQLKMGFSYALYSKTQDLFGNTQGFFNFNGSYTGNDFADFLLGYAHSYNELAVQDHGTWKNISPAAYIQDNWHVNSRLTINLGLRWDGIPHTYEQNNRQSNFFPQNYNPANAAIFAPGSGGNVISPNSPGLGGSPNPILAAAGTQFYLNGIGVAGAGGIPRGLVKDSWLNFGPRVGFAYDFSGDHKTVLRGGFGAMYERIQGNDVYNAGPNVPFSSSVTFNDVSLSNPSQSLITGTKLSTPITVASITGLSYSDYKPPVSYQYSIGVERQLAPNSVLNISYVGNQNRHQNDYRNINVPNQSLLPALIKDGSNNPAYNSNLFYNTVLPYQGFGTISLAENPGNGHYNGLQVSLRSQIKRDLTLNVAYTLSRAIDPSTGGDLYTVSNPYNRAYDNGPSAFDRSNIVVVNFIYDLPIFRHSQNQLLKSALGGWEVAAIGTMETGLPIFITQSGAQSSNGVSGGTNRPNLSGSVSYPGTIATFFTGNFATPAYGQWGSLGKGVIRGPGRDNWNVSLFKSFALNEARGSRLELRVETFNTWNHTEFNNVGTSYGNSQFGQVTSTWDPRTFQLGAKLYF